MISSPNRSRRSGTPVRLVVIHTAEGARTTASLGNYFARAAVKASSHAGIDDHDIETYVPYSEASWTLRSGNNISDNVELCGFAAWTRGQWLTEHRPMLEHTARWIRERCQARGIPIRKLTPAQVAAGEAGVCGHHDWTVGMRDGTHTDPGPGFPWDVVINLATASTSTDWFDMASLDDLRAAVRAELQTIARRDDIGHARNQIMTAIGVDDPVAAPPMRKPEDNAKFALARRVDVGHALDQTKAAIAALPTGSVDTAAVVKGVVDTITAQGLGPLVADELARRLTQ